MAEELEVGQRVRAASDLCSGVVRWIGELPDERGPGKLYAGVEWDDPLRGKHDGFVFNQRLFDCEGVAHRAGRGASLVNVDSLRSTVTFCEAFCFRYGEESGAAASEDDGLSVRTSGGQSMGVQVRTPSGGATQISTNHASYKGLYGIYLPDSLIDSVGDSERIAPNVASASELDVSRNFIPESWAELGELCKLMPKLSSLNISGVRLQRDAGPPSECFSCVTRLALNSLRDGTASWAALALAASSMPSLLHLHARDNGLGRPPREGQSEFEPFKPLETLDLEGNCLSEWSDCAERLGRLPSLKRLHLGRNNLARIGPAADRENFEVSALFPSLETLLLASNRISTWADVDALNTFPKLQELRLSNNMVASQASERYEVVARVGGLTALNGSPLTNKERYDAELRYLRRLLTEKPLPSLEQQPIEPSQEALHEHPRYKELLSKFGERAIAGTDQAGNVNAGSSKIDVKLKCVSPLAGERTEAQKPLPKATTIGNLKLLCESLFSIASNKQHVFLYSGEMPVPDSLEDDEMRLDAMAVDNGTTLLIDEK